MSTLPEADVVADAATEEEPESAPMRPEATPTALPPAETMNAGLLRTEEVRPRDEATEEAASGVVASLRVPSRLVTFKFEPATSL